MKENKNKYYGPIKTKAQAERLASILERQGTIIASDCAKMLRRNWVYFAARPFVGARAVALSECEPLDANRVGSVMNGILGRKE
jgi:hypothetical protein